MTHEQEIIEALDEFADALEAASASDDPEAMFIQAVHEDQPDFDPEVGKRLFKFLKGIHDAATDAE